MPVGASTRFTREEAWSNGLVWLKCLTHFQPHRSSLWCPECFNSWDWFQYALKRLFVQSRRLAALFSAPLELSVFSDPFPSRKRLLKSLP